MMRYEKSDMSAAVLRMGRLVIKEYSAYLAKDSKMGVQEKKFRHRLVKELVTLLKHIEVTE
jgi:hypothetical protein